MATRQMGLTDRYPARIPYIMHNTSRSRRFDALHVGECRESTPWLLDEAAMVEFSSQFDPQWFHVDPVAAPDSAFGGLIASGVHLLALWRRMDHDLNGDIDFYCGVGLENVRFRRAARAGDSLTLRSRIVDCRPSASDAQRGVVKIDYELVDQAGRTVLDLRAINLVYR